MSTLRTIKQWFAMRRLRKQLRAATAYRIAELPEDTPGRFAGTPRPFAEALVAPISQRPCVLYVVEVVLHHLGSAELPLRSVLTEQRGVPFVVEDDGARAIVDPANATALLAFDHSDRGRPVYNTQHQYDLLARHDLLERKWRYIDHLEYREAIVGFDKEVTVLGAGIREPDPDAPPAAAYRTTGPTRLRLTCSAITDDPVLRSS